MPEHRAVSELLVVRSQQIKGIVKRASEYLRPTAETFDVYIYIYIYSCIHKIHSNNNTNSNNTNSVYVCMYIYIHIYMIKLPLI